MPSIPADALTFFKTQAAFRRWLEKRHDKASELWVGFYKVDSGKGGITYKQALDEALCFGWIDGVRKSIDDTQWTIRFTPRKPASIWSQVNIKRVDELIVLGAMAPSGLAAFGKRDAKRTMRYSFENRPQMLPPAQRTRFEKNARAWTFFQAQPPSYQRMMIWWIVSAVKEETRNKRLDLLIANSAAARRIEPMKPVTVPAK